MQRHSTVHPTFLKGKYNNTFSGQVMCDLCIAPNFTDRHTHEPTLTHSLAVVVLYLVAFFLPHKTLFCVDIKTTGHPSLHE